MKNTMKKLAKWWKQMTCAHWHRSCEWSPGQVWAREHCEDCGAQLEMKSRHDQPVSAARQAALERSLSDPRNSALHARAVDYSEAAWQNTQDRIANAGRERTGLSAGLFGSLFRQD